MKSNIFTDTWTDRYGREAFAIRAAIITHLVATLGCILIALNMTESISLPSIVREALFVLPLPLGLSRIACPLISITLIMDLRCHSLHAKICALVITVLTSSVQLVACFPHIQ